MSRWFDGAAFAWQRRLVAYLIVVSSFGLCLVLIQHNYRDDAARAASSVLSDCNQRSQGREVLRQLVVAAYTQAPPDYSRIPSYADLDPATKRFLADLGAASSPDQTGALDHVLAKVPPIVCPGAAP